MGREPNNPIARRLRMLQALVEGTDHGAMTRMAQRLEISRSRWSNIINGTNLSQDVMDQIMKHIPGMSRDWLKDGRREALSSKMDRDLMKMERTFEVDNG